MNMTGVDGSGLSARPAPGNRDARECQFFPMTEMLLDFEIEQAQLLMQRLTPIFWQRLDKVLNHRT